MPASFGLKTRSTGSMWLGWITYLPLKPRARARSASVTSPSMSSISAQGVSSASSPAARAQTPTSLRTWVSSWASRVRSTPISKAKSSPPSISATSRDDAALISSQRSRPRADSMATISSTVPGFTSCATSCSRSSTSISRTARADSVFASRTPARPGWMMAAMSSGVSPLWMLFTRTWTVRPACVRLPIAACTSSRAWLFSSGSTDSSRSRQRTSAGYFAAFSSISCRLPGTKRSVRWRIMEPDAAVGARLRRAKRHRG